MDGGLVLCLLDQRLWLENMCAGGIFFVSQWLFLIKGHVLKGLLVSCLANLLSFN